MEAYKEGFQEFYRCWRAVNAVYVRYARRLGISYAALQVLCGIYSAGGPITQRELCEQTYLQKTTVNAIIKGCVEKGLLTLCGSSSDRRRKEIQLTPSGEAYAAGIVGDMLRAEAAAFAVPDKEAIEIMVDTLGRYAAALDERMNF